MANSAGTSNVPGETLTTMASPSTMQAIPATIRQRRRAAIIVPPFASRHYPSLEASQVRSAILSTGWYADVLYENHSYASFLDEPLYDDIASIQRSIGVGDWICSRILNKHGSLITRDSLDASRFDSFWSYLQSDHNYSPGHLTLFELAAEKFEQFAETWIEQFNFARYDMVLFCCKHQQLSAALTLSKLLYETHEKANQIYIFGEMVNGLAEAQSVTKNCPWLNGILVNSPATVIADQIEQIYNNENVPGLLRTRNGPGIGSGTVSSIESSQKQLIAYQPPSRNGAVRFRPSFDNFYKKYTTDPLQTILPYQASQGCWWKDKSHCTFCGLIEDGQEYQSKPGDQVLQELLASVSESRSLEVVTADLLLDYKYFETLLPQLADLDLDLTLFFEIRSGMSRQQLLLLRDAGVNSVQIGIESFCAATLKGMKKGTTVLKNLRTLKWCHELGMSVSWIYLYGFPEDNIDTLNSQAALVKNIHHLAPPVAVTPVRIEKNSPMYHDPEKFGMQIVSPSEPYLHTFPFATNDLMLLAKEYEHRYLDDRDPTQQATQLITACEQWTAAHETAELYYLRGPDFIKICDFRNSGSVVTLDNWKVVVFDAIDSIATIRQITTQLKHKNFQTATEDVERMLSNLLRLGLATEVSGRYLSLVPRFNRSIHRKRPA